MHSRERVPACAIVPIHVGYYNWPEQMYMCSVLCELAADDGPWIELNGAMFDLESMLCMDMGMSMNHSTQ